VQSICSSSSSWILVQPHASYPKCFPPKTIFMRVDGSLVRAAELAGEGGDILQGPTGTHARVLTAITHKKENRNFVRLNTSESMLEVTADHRVIVEGSPTTLGIDEVETSHRVLTGCGFKCVQSVDVFTRTSEVVEVVLEDDAQVLAWSPMAKHVPKVDEKRAFAVRGGVHQPHHYICEQKSFLDLRRNPSDDAQIRSHSADADMSKKDGRRLQYARKCTFPRMHVASTSQAT